MDLNLSSSTYSAVSETLTSVEEVLSSVKNALKSESVTDEVREELLQALDSASRKLSSLEKVAGEVNRFALSYFAQLREKAISLYGEVDDSYLHHEIVLLQGETHQLEETIGEKDFEAVALRIKHMKDHLSKILNEFRPALQERRSLVAAKLVLEKAEALIRGEELSELALTEWSMLETEAILEEIAEYLADHNRGALRLLMQRLTPMQRRLVGAYLEPKDLLSHFLHDVKGAADESHVVAV